MRITFAPNNEAVWLHHYQNQVGRGLGFSGLRYQRGNGLGNIFRNIFNAILPIAKPLLGSAAKTLGNEALSLGANLANDVLDGQNVKKAFQKRTHQSINRLSHKARKKMTGRGLGIKPHHNKTISLKAHSRNRGSQKKNPSKKKLKDILGY